MTQAMVSTQYSATCILTQIKVKLPLAKEMHSIARSICARLSVHRRITDSTGMGKSSSSMNETSNATKTRKSYTLVRRHSQAQRI